MSSNFSAAMPSASSSAAAKAKPESQFNIFTLFPKLPLELRRLVWRMTFDTAHHVHLHCHMTYRPDRSDPCHGLGSVLARYQEHLMFVIKAGSKH